MRLPKSYSGRDVGKFILPLIEGAKRDLKVKIVSQKRLIHSKIYIIDGLIAITGSANLTYSGMKTNHETMEIKKSKSSVNKLRKLFYDLW